MLQCRSVNPRIPAGSKTSLSLPRHLFDGCDLIVNAELRFRVDDLLAMLEYPAAIAFCVRIAHGHIAAALHAMRKARRLFRSISQSAAVRLLLAGQ